VSPLITQRSLSFTLTRLTTCAPAHVQVAPWVPLYVALKGVAAPWLAGQRHLCRARRRRPQRCRADASSDASCFGLGRKTPAETWLVHVSPPMRTATPACGSPRVRASERA